MPPRQLTPMDDAAAARHLRHGRVEILGRMPRSSNATFLAHVCADDQILEAVYKPARGERTLWDFPENLYRREVAAYELDRQLGWNLVPVTVTVPDGPLGEGSLQRLVDADLRDHYFTLRDRTELVDQLRRVCLFDLLANNTDRKSGHCLLGPDDRIWAIDNALCFHAEFKLRTVIWDFAGEPIAEDDLTALTALAETGPSDALDGLLTAPEHRALRQRCEALLDARVFPHDPTGRRYPWPMV